MTAKSSSPPDLQARAMPAGPQCNLACTYCHYMEKAELFPGSHPYRMSDEVLEAFIQQNFAAKPAGEVIFTWQGGEPTLAGRTFFEKVLKRQAQHGRKRKVRNVMQTNATQLDADWCRFLKENAFELRLSLDGPELLHDVYRRDSELKGSFKDTLRGLALLQEYDVPFETHTVVGRANVAYPLPLYNFLKESGSRLIHFTPLVERYPDPASHQVNFRFSHPPQKDVRPPKHLRVTDWSVPPHEWSTFLRVIFDHWASRDRGKVRVQIFEDAFAKWQGKTGRDCALADNCGASLTVEHNGDVYVCDQFVYPRYRIGNILKNSLSELLEHPQVQETRQAKTKALPAQCQRCNFLFACHGDCPKHRFAYSSDGKFGVSYLCPGYLGFFRHIDSTMRRLIQQESNGVDAVLAPRTARRSIRASRYY